ncbi:MAG: hypothetical protein WC861_06810, partial [Candidatus Micrarchaeia archaeon]
MHRQTCIFLLAAAFLIQISSLASASNITSECAILSTAGETYILNQSVNISGATCFNITAQSITLDCNGYTLTGDTTTNMNGIYSNQNNTTVKNCVVINFYIGISLLCSNSTLYNANITAVNRGVYSQGSQYGRNSISFFNANAQGAVSAPYYSNISNFTANSSNGWGIYLSTTFGNNIFRDFNAFGAVAGIGVQANSIGNTFNNFNVSSGGYAIRKLGGVGFTFNNFSNFVANSTSTALSLGASHDNTFTNFTAIGGAPLIDLTSAYSNTFVNGTLWGAVSIPVSGYNNTFYWNNFTNSSSYYVKDLNGGNYYNTTISGHAEGNIYANVLNGSVQAIGTNLSAYGNGLYYGTSGTGVPYNITTSAGKFNCSFAGCADYAPLTHLSQDAINLTLNGSQANFTAAYGTSPAVSASSLSGTHLLYLDGTETANPFTASLAAGYYNFTANSTGNADYLAASATFFANITRAPSTAGISAISWSVQYGSDASINCSIDNSQSNLSLYRNDTLMNSSFGSNLSITISSLAIGAYNFTCNATESENYSAASGASGALSVSQAADTITLRLNSSEANFTAVYGTPLAVNASSTSNTQSIYRNGTLVGTTNYTATLAAGYYNFTANSTGNENYTGAGKTYFANITKAPATANISAANWSIQYGSDASINCSIDNSQSNLSLYRNDTLMNSSFGSNLSITI